MSKEFWGPATWKLIHSMAAAYIPTDNNYVAFKNFITSLVYLLPCPVCREHFKINIKKYPIEQYLQSNKTLFYWTYIMHDLVNKQNGKVSPQYDYVRSFYFNGLKEDCESCKN
jgi:Erv1 / Alr family